MPELPEVEFMASRLHPMLCEQTVTEASVLRNPGGRYDGAKAAVGRRILYVVRRGKYLVFRLDDRSHLLCHNAMSGYWDSDLKPWTFDYVEGSRQATDKDVRVFWRLDNGERVRFHDSRLFGNIRHIPANETLPFGKMGPEAISTPFLMSGVSNISAENLGERLHSKKPVKQLLMEQERIAGLGNIYAAEALWWARLHPNHTGDTLSKDEVRELYRGIRLVLNKALDHDLDYGSYLQVYRQELCECGEKIQKIDITKRSTYFCVRCQH